MLAFVVLILSSASTTTLVGDAVLGGKTFQLAKSKADVNLRTAWQIWEGQLVSMRRVLDISSLLGFDPQALLENNALLTSLMKQGLFDFVGLANRDGDILAHAPALTGDPTIPKSFDVVARSLKTNHALASASLVPLEDAIQHIPNLTDRLDAFNGVGEILLVLAAALLEGLDRFRF